nr:protein ABHD17B [Ipomoea trifida]
MRNPSRQEIMGITQRLSQYGKIEEKNVFYWFQNQKGRERQQRKRLATLAAEAATPHDLRQQATVGGSSEHATKHPMLETLPLFPMHSDRRRGRALCFTSVTADKNVDVHYLLDTNGGNKIVSTFWKHPFARFTLLYSHGNATDLGQMQALLSSELISVSIS